MPSIDFSDINLTTNLPFHHRDTRSLELWLMRKVLGTEQIRNWHVFKPSMTQTSRKRRARMTSTHLCPLFALFLRQVVEDIGSSNRDICLMQPSLVLYPTLAPGTQTAGSETHVKPNFEWRGSGKHIVGHNDTGIGLSDRKNKARNISQSH